MTRENELRERAIIYAKYPAIFVGGSPDNTFFVKGCVNGDHLLFGGMLGWADALAAAGVITAAPPTVTTQTAPETDHNRDISCLLALLDHCFRRGLKPAAVLAAVKAKCRAVAATIAPNCDGYFPKLRPQVESNIPRQAGFSIFRRRLESPSLERRSHTHRAT